MRRFAALLVASALTIVGCTPKPSAHTRVVLRASTAASPETLDQARRLIAQRLEAAGLGKAQVTRDGDRRLNLDIPGTPDRADIATLVKPAILTLRLVLDATDGSTQTDVIRDTGDQPTLAATTAKLGPAYQAALGLTTVADPRDERLKAFGQLTPGAVSVLPVEVQFRVPGIGCPALNFRIPQPLGNRSARLVACDESTKYLLDVANVDGADVKTANVTRFQTGDYGVMISFTVSGQAKWTELTRRAVANSDSACSANAVGPQGHCRVAIVLDSAVLTSPEVLDVITGDAQVTGNMAKSRAETLAADLTSGALPVSFDVISVDTVRV